MSYFENNGKHWLLQIFGAAVDQTREELTRADSQKMFDAATTGDYHQVKRLVLSKKVSIDDREPLNNETPLMTAITWGMMHSLIGDNTSHRKIITFLIENKADTSAVDKSGRDIWSLAEGNKEILALLPPKPSTAKQNQSPNP